MEEFVLKNRKRLIAVLAFLTAALLLGTSFAPIFFSETIQAQENEDITVTAVVEAWLDFQVSTTTLNITPSLVQADGTLNVGSTSDLDLSVGTNSPTGWQVEIRGANNGLYSTARDHTIGSVTATSTIATGTEAYGANATSSNATIGSYYDYYGTDTVGEIRGVDRSLASKNTPNTLESVADMQVKATASETTPPGTDYEDTITLTASAVL